MRRFLVGMLLGASLTVAASGLARSKESNERLPPGALGLLQPRMVRHAAVLKELVWSVVLLEQDKTRFYAEALESEARIARPLPGRPDDLNAQLPPLFFDLQDTMHDAARTLGRAAARGDNAEVAHAFGTLMQTCVACHTSYLPPRGR